jgi:hypothetical protein
LLALEAAKRMEKTQSASRYVQNEKEKDREMKDKVGALTDGSEPGRNVELGTFRLVSANFPVASNDEEVIVITAVGVRQVGDYPLDIWPILQVIGIRAFPDHVIAEANLPKPYIGMVQPIQLYYGMDDPIGIDGDLHRVKPIPAKHFTEKAIERKSDSTLDDRHQRDVKGVRVIPITRSAGIVDLDGNISRDVVPSPELCHFFRRVY